MQQIANKPLKELPLLEELLFYRYGYNLYEAILPMNIATNESRDNNQDFFSDCGETSLRNFFNALLFNAETRQFNTSILNNLGADEKLVAFYKKYQTADYIHTQQARDDWASVVSGLPEVNYNRENKYEISDHNSGSKNMLKVIANLIPGINSFKTLSEKLAQDPIGIEMAVNGEPSDDSCVLSFDIKKPGNAPFTIDWKFERENFIVIYPSFPKVNYQYICEKLFDELIQGKFTGTLWHNFMLCVAFNGPTTKYWPLLTQKMIELVPLFELYWPNATL